MNWFLVLLMVNGSVVEIPQADEQVCQVASITTNIDIQRRRTAPQHCQTLYGVRFTEQGTVIAQNTQALAQCQSNTPAAMPVQQALCLVK